MSSTEKAPAPISRRSVLVHGVGATVAASGLLGRPAFAAGEVKLGWIQPTTGPLASSFGPNYVAADIALEEINANGGILGSKLVKVAVDDQASPAQEPIVTRKLIDEGCKYILGPVGSSHTLASLAVSTPLKIIQGGYASAPEAGDAKRYPYHYSCTFTADSIVEEIANYYKARKFKRVGLLIEDSAAGEAIRVAAKRELAARGLQIVSDQTFPLKTPDMTPYLRKLRSDGAEALQVMVSVSGDITQMLVGLSRLGWKPPVAGASGLLFVGLPGAVPDDARYQDVYSAIFRDLTYTDSQLPPERVRNFVKKIAASNLTEAQLGYAATSPFYDFLYALKYGVEKAKSWDTDAVKHALDTAPSVPGLFGPMKFTAESHIGYGASVVGLAVSNSMQEPTSKAYRGLLRRRAPAV
jgi:ABC-type branched-subunit amino acid transport system substrate-binding protein